MGITFVFPDAADLADDTLDTKPHSELHGDLGDTFEAYIAALGKVTASGHSALPTLFDPSADEWYEKGWWQIEFLSTEIDVYINWGAHASFVLSAADDGVNRNAALQVYTDDDTGSFSAQLVPGAFAIADGTDLQASLDFRLTGRGDPILLFAGLQKTQATLIGVGAANAIHAVAETGTPTSGAYTLLHGATPIGPIAYNANQAAVQGAFDTALGGGNATVTGGADSFTVEFTGTFGDAQQFLETLSSSTLDDGTVTITNVQNGSAAQTDPILDLQDGDSNSLFAIAPDGSVGGAAPTLGGAIRWDGTKYVASAV